MNSFTKWSKWSEHLENSIKMPGIYVIAYSTQNSFLDKEFYWNKDIIYIGMTNSKGGLKQRLKQFDNTIKGKLAHGGADRVMFDFKDLEYDEFIKNLYVSVLSFKADTSSPSLDDYRVMGDVAKAEYDCFAKFRELFGDLPKYNRYSSQKLSHFRRKNLKMAS